MIPRPNSVPYNDWRQLAVEPLETFTPTLPVSVIIPACQPPAELLARTLAALEGQGYPRHLFEVIIVDDGSEPPLALTTLVVLEEHTCRREPLESEAPLTPPRAAPLDVKVVRQARREFGLARARNAGVRSATHDILLFLDCGMLVEADWIAAHARWHHAVADAVTLAGRVAVAMDGIDAQAIRERPGALGELFAHRPAHPEPSADVLLRTNELTSKDDDLYLAMVGANFGVRKDFYWLTGGHDESFARRGGEDTEFCYRAYTRGGLLVPVRDALGWHQGQCSEDRERKDREKQLQYRKMAHLIPAPDWYRQPQPGRIYTVPKYVVTIDAGSASTERVIETTANILADREHDLAVRIEMPACGDDERLAWLRETFDPDPRVQVAPAGAALDGFPATPFHVALPAGVAFDPDLVPRLRAALGAAVSATATLPDGSRVSITRAWALHRARRAGQVSTEGGTEKGVADFGEARTLYATTLKVASAAATAASSASQSAGTSRTRRDTTISAATDTQNLVDSAGQVLQGEFKVEQDPWLTLARQLDLRAEKIVSRKYRYLWLCNPKVGSRSTMVALLGIDPAAIPDGRTIAEVYATYPQTAALCTGRTIAEVYAMYPEVKDYYSFAFIRHPFDRALSFYSEMNFLPERYKGRQGLHKEQKRQNFFDQFQGLAEIDTFSDFCLWLNTPGASDQFADRHFLSQHLQIRLPDGRLPDFIGRLEYLEEDLNLVANHLGMPVPILPILNTVTGWQASPDALQAARTKRAGYLTERNKVLLSLRYANDLKLYRDASDFRRNKPVSD